MSLFAPPTAVRRANELVDVWYRVSHYNSGYRLGRQDHGQKVSHDEKIARKVMILREGQPLCI